MAASGQPTKSTPVDLYPPAKPVPVPAPSALQRRAEAQVARDSAAPPTKGNRHQTEYR